LAVLPFDVRCFAAAYGWICAGGGDSGDFAILRPDTSSRHELASPEIKHFGSDIVNSVSIHRLEGPANGPGQVVDDIVAVVTGNDRLVRILSLSREKEAAELDLPFFVNHATISPDGQLLVAVGDYQQAYFYERTPIPASQQRTKLDAPPVYASSLCTWELLNIVMLHVPKPTIITGYFTTAWSPSTRLCAVASECGYVSIIDVEWLKKLEDGEDAIVAVIPGTRPELQPGPGAVRSMMFSPSPWDLLIWAEDQGRVVVADLRASCKIQQVLKLDKDAPNVNKVEIESADQQKEQRRRVELEEGADEFEVLQSYLDQYERAAAARRQLEQQLADVQRNNDALRAESEANNARAAGYVDDPTYGLQLSPRERHVLDAVTTRSGPSSRAEESVQRAMLREDRDRESSSATPRSIQHRPSETGGRRSDTSREIDFPALTRTMGNPNSSNDDTAQSHLVRNYLRQRSSNGVPDWEIITHQAARDILYTPRRQASVVLSNEDIEAMLNTTSALDAASRNINATTTTSSPPSSSPFRPSRQTSDLVNETANNVPNPNSSSSTSTNLSSSARFSSPPGDAIIAAAEALRRRRQFERLHAMTIAATRNSSSSSSTTNINPRDAWTFIRSSPRNRTREPEDGGSRADERLDRLFGGSSSSSANSNGANAAASSSSTSTRRDEPARDAQPRRSTLPDANPTPSSSASTSTGTTRAPDVSDAPTLGPNASSIYRRAQFPSLYQVREMQAQQMRVHGYHWGTANPAYGAQTAGLAWSEDGRRLWVGCEEGIWGFEIEVKGRMVRPVWEAR